MVIDTERFEVERVVGSGSMGTVFRARDRESNQPVALKIIRNDSPSRSARFEREAEVLEMLEHPSIVRYIGHGVTRAGERFLVMEWLDGETLKARIHRDGLSLGETLDLGARIAGGLAAAHAAGVVHRDVKPTNLVLVGGAVAGIKLIDFGVAAWKKRGEASDLTETGDVIGTPAYMAPEQAAGRKVGPPADVFGLGCVLYECISGRAPFILSRHLAPRSMANTSVAPALRSLRAEVPQAISQLVERMIAREPRERPRDGAALVAELADVATIDVAAVGPPVRTRRAAPAEATAMAAGPALGSSSDGFARLRREHQSAPELSPTATRILAVLARHVSMPLAVLRRQCERCGKDPQVLEITDLVQVAPALADAVARFTNPTLRELVLAELAALAGKADRTC